MNTFAKRSFIGLLGAALTLAAGGVYYSVKGALPMPAFFMLGISMPQVIGFLFVHPKRGPELDERDRLIGQKGMLIGLGVAFVALFVSFEGVAMVLGSQGKVAVRDLRYLFPLSMLLAVLAHHLYVWSANRELAL